MVTNCGELLSLVRDQDAVFGFDLVCGTPFVVEPSRDDDAVTIKIVFVRFIATVLEGDGDFRGSEISE